MGIKCSELKGTFFRNKNLSADKNEKKLFHILMTVQVSNKNDKSKKLPDICK